MQKLSRESSVKSAISYKNSFTTQQTSKLLCVALAGTALMLGSSNAMAQSSTSTTYYNYLNDVVSSSYGNMAYTSVSTGSYAINKFDTSQGVLTSVTTDQQLSVYSLTNSVSASGGGIGKAIGTAAVTAASTTLGGLTSTFYGAGNTLATGPVNCTGTTCSNSITISGIVDVNLGYANLSAFTGTGVMTGNERLVVTSKTTGVNTGGNATAQAYDQLTTTVTYGYLAHSNGSFNANADKNVFNYDFGTLTEGSAASKNFSIYNDALNATGMDFVSAAITSGSGFNLGSLAFSNLTNGNVATDAITFNTSTAGTFSETIKLKLADTANVGVGQKDNYLTINVSGTVVAAVPEPETYAMLLAGLGLVGTIVRRRKAKQAS